jgi:class 3 adenylate cyclase/tetratricopeptide (TPR) repeat protein
MPLLTILFTDVVESTATKRAISLGRDTRERDHAYLEQVQSPYFALVRQCCQSHGGKEVTTMGDAFYLTFENPVDAVRCSVQIQQRLAESPIHTPLGPLRVRIGIHSGFPEFFEGSWHGADVDTAKRVESAASDRQILLSGRTYELVRQMTDVKFHACGEFALKGVERISLWEADWDNTGPRKTAASPLPSEARRKFALTGLSVLAALVLIVVALGYWERSRSTSQKHAEGEEPLAPAMKPRRSVAVFGFKNLTTQGVDWLSGALSELLSTELAAGEQLRTIAGEDVTRTTADLSLHPMPSYSKETLLRVRKILGSDFVIAGSYVTTGSRPPDAIRLDVRLQDAASGETVAAFQEAGTVGALSALLKKVASDLRTKLGVQEPTSTQSSQASAAVPADPEAMRLYSEGLTKLRTFDALGARDSLDRAVAREPKLAVAHAALANSWQLLGYDLKAQDEAKKAFDLSANLSPEDRRSIEGRYRQLTSEWDKAIVIYRSLWEVFQDEPSYALELAKVQTAAGKGQDALATLAELRKLPHMDEDPRVDLARAFAAESLSDVKQQQSAAATAAEKASRQGSRYLAAQAYWQQCVALNAMGELQKATTACQQSAVAAPFAPQIEARTKTVEASILLAQGQPAEALELRRQALDTARKIGSQKDVIGALMNIANIQATRGQTAEALKDEREAIGIAREIGDKQQLLTLENNLASDLETEGSYQQAKALFEDSLKTARDIGDQGGISMALLNLGALSLQTGDPSFAEQQIRQALDISERANLQSNTAFGFDYLGDVQVAKGEFADARRSYEHTLKLFTDAGDQPNIAGTHLSLAKLALEQGKPADAESLARQAIQGFEAGKLPDIEADALGTCARALILQGKLQDARSELANAARLGVQDRMIRISLAITAARLKTRIGKLAEARQDLDSLLKESKEKNLVGLQLEIRLALAEIDASSESKQKKASATALEHDARNSGYLLVATKAGHLQASRSR